MRVDDGDYPLRTAVHYRASPQMEQLIRPLLEAGIDLQQIIEALLSMAVWGGALCASTVMVGLGLYILHEKYLSY